MTRRFAPALVAALLAGCTAGPNYHRPPAAIADHPAATGAFVGGNEKAYAAAPLPDHWWQLYQDTTLDRLVTDAIAHNTDLRVAAANLARANAALDLTEDAGKPQTALGIAPGYAQRSAEEEMLPGAPLPSAFVYSASAGISYQLDLAGQIRRAVEAANADVAATQAAYDAVKVTVVADTTRAYLDACSAGREIQVAQHSLDLQQQTTTLTQKMIHAGRGISLDATRSRVQEEQVRATLPTLLAAKQVALYRLATLIGRPPAEFDRDVAACTAEPRLTQAIPIGDGAALLRRRPDVRRAEFELHAATARIGVAEAELYPRVTLGASLGSVGLLKNAFAADTYKFSLGPLISWEFPNRGRARARIAGAQAETDAAFARFDGAVLGALREAETALTIYARDLDRRAALQQARDQAAQAAEDAEKLFRAGRTGFLPTLDAQRTLIGAEQTLAAADSKLAADQVQLFLALGGGWQA